MLSGEFCGVDGAARDRSGALHGQGAVGGAAERGCADGGGVEALIATGVRFGFCQAAQEDAGSAEVTPGVGFTEIRGEPWEGEQGASMGRGWGEEGANYSVGTLR